MATWNKNANAKSRRYNLLASTDHRKSMHDRYVQAQRKAQWLANTSTDPQTVLLAKKDVAYFSRKIKET